jgi:hypothetical protein
MKKISLFLFLILLLEIDFSYCQNKDSLNIKENIIFGEPQFNPVFPGGEKALYCFIYHNIDTVLLQKKERIGTIFVNFVIDTTGKPTDFKILRSVDSIADNEFLRVLKLMPIWEPGYIVGYNKKVPITYMLPLKLPYVIKFCR